MPATATPPVRRALTALLLCVFTVQTVVGNALAGEVAASDAAGYGAFQVPAPDPRPTWGISAAGDVTVLPITDHRNSVVGAAWWVIWTWS